MKKIIAILISTMLFMTTVFANVEIPEELLKYPDNFTASTSISISIDDNSDIRNLLEEITKSDGAMAGVMGMDFFNVLTAIFEYNGTVDVQADVSSDYKKIKLALTNNSELSSVVSANLNYNVESKYGLWADIDLTNEEAPKCDVIFLLPTSDKYRHISFGEYITQEDMDPFNEFFNSDEWKKMVDEFAGILYKNSTIEKTGAGYKLSMDNDGFVAYMNEVIRYNSDYGTEFDGEAISMFSNMQFLGKDGITAVYTLKNGKISSGEVDADIQMNISEIAMSMGEDWPYEASGIIKIKIHEKIDFTRIGTTEVKYPVLTDSNSISLNKVIDDQMAPENSFEYVIEYPYGYVDATAPILPVVDGGYYVPLRSILEDGYYETVSIDYQDGVITATCEFFKGFSTLKMTIGDDKIYVDDTEYKFGTIMCIDGVTYVNTRLFTEVFGWELSNITHEILDGSFNVGFWTSV